MMNSFLLAGQSNMAGRGFIKEVPLIFSDRIKMLRNGRWQTMWEPIHFDRPTAGIGLGSGFSAAWIAQYPESEIGLIPCADGNTSLDEWSVGGTLFENAVFQAKLAMKNSSLSGILWHQGENDSFMQRFKHYEEKLNAIVDGLRQTLNLPGLPFICGGLGDFLTSGKYGSYFSEYRSINNALLQFSNTHNHCYFATAENLEANSDKIHLNASSLRKFGLRYFYAFQQRKNILAPLTDEDEQIARLANRKHTPAEKKAIIEIQYSLGAISSEEFERQMVSIG